MFQPQSTPYSPFVSYGGATNSEQDQSSFPSYQLPGLGLLTGGPLEFDNPVFSPVPSFPALPVNIHQNRYTPMATPATDDLAAQETLARAYQPELKGPLVGEKRSSLEITAEYAKADPIYVAKTLTLPRNYSHYRPVKGDGNCGWRAIAFSYVETLQKLGDKKVLLEECDRMLNLTDWVASMTNHESWIFEDMRDCLINLLREVSHNLHLEPTEEKKSVLLNEFNDQGESDGMVYWCRLLASAYLKANPGAFQDFIPDLIGVDNYCRDVLEPSNNEIEHLGITLLFEVLLKPIGVALEIVYLDRSEGTEANVHYLKPDVPNAASSTIHLLYRPGHYDILYKDTPTRSQSLSQQQISETAAAHSNVQVNRATNFTHRHSLQETPGNYNGVDMSILMNMPMPFGTLPIHPRYTESFRPVSDFSPPPTQAPTPSYRDSSRTTHSISPSSSVSSGPPIFPSSIIPMHPPQTISPNITPPVGYVAPGGSQFRPSLYQYRDDWGDAPAQGFQTSTFKNSHYNISHYNNPNFQPEQWTPDCDEAVNKLTRRGTS